MNFYRVENAQRRGCYAGTKENVVNSSITAEHPLPSDDSLLGDNFSAKYGKDMDWEFQFGGSLRYGFNSLEQFRAWFYSDDDLKALKEKGYTLSLYEVPHVIEGNSQSCINKTHHTPKRLKRSIDLGEFIKELIPA